MPARGQHGSARGKSRRAAELYVAGGIEVEALCDRFGLSPGAVYQAVKILRRERGIAGPRSEGC